MRAEIAMNKSSLAALAAAAAMVGILASVGSATAADGAPAAKMQSDKTQSDKRQSANASTQRNDELSLSDAQRKTAWQDLVAEPEHATRLRFGRWRHGA